MSENNVFRMPTKHPSGPLPLLQAFLSCFHTAMKDANYTVNGAEATVIFSGRLIKLNLRDMGPAPLEPITGFASGLIGPPDGGAA